VIPHPIADNDDGTLRAKADAVMARLVALLTGPPAATPR
jgi:hypothetical protein